LARTLARTAVRDLVERASSLEADLETAERVHTPNFRGFQHLDVVVVER
jgi:hypothetical protein